MAEKRNYKKITSPKATARYCWLDTPNTKFNKSGVWSVDLVMPVEEAQDLMKTLDEAAEEAFAEAVAQAKPADKKKIIKGEPYQLECDEETGDETGNVIFKLKNNATFKKKDGSIGKVTIQIFDAKAKPIKGATGMRSGSTIKAAFQLVPYFVAGTKTAGITLRLNAVQIIELVTGGGNAGAYGFEEEDGYEASEGAGDEFSDESEGTEEGGEEGDF